MKEVILHGECMAFPSEIPQNAVKFTPNNKYVIVAPSETTGNHHVVDLVDGADWWKTEGDEPKLFMQNTKPTKIRCTLKERHDEITLEPGVWEFGIQQEYDPFAARMRNVAD